MTQGAGLSVSDAAAATGRSKSTILRAIRSGQVSAARDDAGNFQIDASELSRAFSLVRPVLSNDAPRRINGAPDAVAWQQLEARLSDALSQVDDLKRRLDKSEDERRATAEKLTALLSDSRSAPAAAPDSPSPARRSWWPWRRALAVALLAGCGSSLCLAAEGSFGTGYELLSDCSEPPGQYGYALCLGYVLGVGPTAASVVHCPPEGSTRGQAIDAVVRYLRAHPETRYYPASTLTQMALAQAFPCKG